MDMIRKFQEKNGMIMKEESQSFGFPTPPPTKKRTEETQNRKNHESKLSWQIGCWLFFLPAIPTTKRTHLKKFP